MTEVASEDAEVQITARLRISEVLCSECTLGLRSFVKGASVPWVLSLLLSVAAQIAH